VFLREADSPERSWITLELQEQIGGYRTVQARCRFNAAPSAEQHEVIDKYLTLVGKSRNSAKLVTPNNDRLATVKANVAEQEARLARLKEGRVALRKAN
jgi:hypothetical protein